MSNKNTVLCLLFVFLLTFATKADVPPDVGKTRVSLDLVIETKENLSDYRFFLDFYGDLKEIKVRTNERTTVAPMGGGARYSSGKLFAVPKKSLGDLGENPSSDELKNLSAQFAAGKIENLVELATHRFSQDIFVGATPDKGYYIIRRDAQTLKAERISESKPEFTLVEEFPYNTNLKLITGGILITFAVVFFGVFMFRKASKKSKINL